VGKDMAFRKNEQGSMVVEAALILPIFLSLLLLLITFIRISIVEIALDHGLSEATKQVASHMYPVALGFDRLSESEAGQKVLQAVDIGKQYRDQVIEVEDQISVYSSLFPEEIGQLLLVRQDMEAGVLADYDHILSSIFQPYVDLFIDKKIVNLERLQVTKVTLPNFKNRDAAYFGLEVRYDMPLQIPFINKKLIFKKKAYERVWVGDYQTKNPGDNKENQGDQEDQGDEDVQEEESEYQLVIESITSPIQRGARAKDRGSIIARGPPNQNATIEIYYVSKFQKKIDCRLNASGWLKCEIEIGPASKEGTYKVVIKAKGQEASKSFEVLSKPNMDKYIEDRNKAAEK
jgi:hypothetical protein